MTTATATATEMISAWEDQVLETVRQSQDAVVKPVRLWAEASKNLIPELPSLPSLPSLPFSDQIPTLAELVERYFQYADKLLGAQKEYIGAVLEAAAPVLGKNGAPTPTR
jgi:3-methyladenine DNA glycosylase AlkC